MTRFGRPFTFLAVVFTFLVFAAPIGAAAPSYEQIDLVSDGSITAAHIDTNLVNSWGIAFDADGFACVADNHTGVATFYDGNGVVQATVITIPPPGGVMGTSAPTGVVFNPTPGFVVSNDGTSGPAKFIFATEDGTISGWNSTVNATNAILKVDNSQSAIYKGLAIDSNGTGYFIYAADFHGAKIDVFDSSFAPVTLAGSFVDPKIPAGYAPFGIQNINGDIYVTYAKQGVGKVDDVPGKGHGFVSVFDANGNFIRRVATRGQLNSPWGVAVAPASFGRFADHLLIGNFGDGVINAFDLASGNFQGHLRESNGKGLVIDGLWGIHFGNGVHNQPRNTLFFASGPADEAHGLYGKITPAP